MDDQAQVYINWGRFVADCSNGGCTDACEVQPGQTTMVCFYGHRTRLVWPPNPEQLMAVLAERISDKRRNWFPTNHPLAVVTGQPHGQTIDQLKAETQAGEQADAEAIAAKKRRLLADLREFGLEVDATGQVIGRL